MDQSQSTDVTNPPLSFTRYLYIVNGVKSSLLLSILNRNLDESLFWCYELYYSGYIDDLFEMVNNIYKEFYSKMNPKLGIFIKKIQKDWEKKSNRDCIIGTMVYNLINREYCVSDFIQKYSDLHFNLVYKESSKPECKICIMLEEKDIEKYKTIEVNKDLRNYQYLKNVAKYDIHEYANVIFEHDHSNLTYIEIVNIYYEKWLYYSSYSPLWLNRIQEYDGSIDHENKKIDFHDENKEDEFYSRFNYETDEQPMSVTIKNIGISNEEKWTWVDFYKKYSY